MVVELVGGSLKGVFALVRNQGCTGFRSLTHRAGEGFWRLRVILPAQRWWYMTCKAIREGDEMACSCGLRWDINDDDRPQCPADRDDTPYSPAVEGTEAKGHKDPDVAKDALKELHHIVEDKES